MLAVTLLAAVSPADAQSRRREREQAEKPRPNYDYASELAQCAPPFQAALRGLLAGPGPQPMATTKAVRGTMPELNGRWVFHDTGDRRRQRDDMGRLVEGNQVCAEEITRGGRNRCARWEARVANAEPPVPVPPPSKDEQRVIGAIGELVANKGAPPEFLGNGRYTIMTERAAGDLEAYLGQDDHPAICSGTHEFIDFFETRLAPLRKRMETVAELRQRSLALVAPRVVALRTLLTAPPTVPSPVADAASVAPAGPLAASVATAATPAPPSPVPAAAAPTSPVRDIPPPASPPPADAAGWLAEVAGMMLSAEDAASVRAAPDPVAGLRRMAELMAGGRTNAPAAARSSAKGALRMVEAAAYIDLLAARYRDLDRALFGTMDGVRKAYDTHCTCGG